MDDLQGKTAVVTGAGGGIGEGIAHAAAEKGMKVVVADIREAEAQRVAAAINAKASGATGPQAIAVQVDVSDLASVEAMATAAEAAFGEVDLLCNNAGVWVGALMQDADMADWDYLIKVNYYGVIHGVKAFLPKMLARKSGHIVNTSSMGGLLAGPPEGLYCTTKFAIMGLSEALLMEVAAEGVGVSVLCPGLVDTGLIANLANRPEAMNGTAEHSVEAPDTASGISPIDVGQRVIDAVRENQFYIITHNEYRDILKMKFDGILEAIDQHAERYS